MSESSPRRSGYARLLDRAMRILAMRDHGEQELRRKLAATLGDGADERDATPDDLERVIAQCLEHHWIDDERFAQRYLAGRSRKGYGPQRIRQELQQKGVLREYIDAALAASETDWEAQAQVTAEKKFGSPLPAHFPEKAKVQRFLLYRGFYMEDIQSIYRNFNV
ncbi:regulatory protein RecX [Enterobacteriaceae bacterium 4M9]|nr:regulatory protein RecX [Enterobacteriaceae bacterium 4M9]